MSDVPKQEKLVINKPFKANTLGAHTQPRRAPPMPQAKATRANPFTNATPP